MSYNVGGIRMSEAAFRKLKQEISLHPIELGLPALWGSEEFRLHTGVVPLGNGIFRKILVRESRIPEIDARSSLNRWTERSYYEVCTHPAIFAELEGQRSAKAGM